MTKLKETKKKLDEMTAISQQALADLQNYKRRIEEEKGEFVAFANAALLTELLPSIDSINKALDHKNKDADWAKGVEHTLNQLILSLGRMGLKAIPTKGQKFDPSLHEALLMAPGEKDIILEELEKGYTLNKKVLKHSRVKVGNGEKSKKETPEPPAKQEQEKAPA